MDRQTDRQTNGQNQLQELGVYMSFLRASMGHDPTYSLGLKLESQGQRSPVRIRVEYRLTALIDDRMSSVRLSVCDVGGSGPHRLKILEANCANS